MLHKFGKYFSVFIECQTRVTHFSSSSHFNKITSARRMCIKFHYRTSTQNIHFDIFDEKFFLSDFIGYRL